MPSSNKFVSYHPEGMLVRHQTTIFNSQTKLNKNIQLDNNCDELMSKNFAPNDKYSNLNMKCNRSSKTKAMRSYQINKNFWRILLLCITLYEAKTNAMTTALHLPAVNNKHPTAEGMKVFLQNPCGFHKDNPALKDAEKNAANNNMKFYLNKIRISAKTGLSDFTHHLENFLKTDFNIPPGKTALIIKHHDAWKHRFNPNLLPNGKILDIEYLKDISEETKSSASEAAKKFSITNDEDRKDLLTILEDCDERLQRLLVVFYQMHRNLANSQINYRDDEQCTTIIRNAYTKGIEVIRISMCDVRTAVLKMHAINETSNQSVRIVDADYILNKPFKTDSLGDWLNMRQLHSQLDYMTRLFGIWVKEMN